MEFCIPLPANSNRCLKIFIAMIVLACTVADWREPFSLPRGWLLWAGIGLVGAVVAVALTGAATSFFSGQTPEREKLSSCGFPKIKAFGMILRMGEGLWVLLAYNSGR
ncbi:uncharacterized protein LOC121052908 isoform X1 [Rosa chinensis]|uniref:uncharacterized protein LOC121052908 isoform X1 n=1 Tax=Rosa chinensis TaxID=74649 RepID=UPI001AD8B327|nr:uncharacterized protein LOC121052908 isoform X1 [Rosa chinensis]